MHQNEAVQMDFFDEWVIEEMGLRDEPKGVVLPKLPWSMPKWTPKNPSPVSQVVKDKVVAIADYLEGKVDVSSKSDFIYVSQEVYHNNTKLLKSGNFEMMPRSTYEGIMSMVNKTGVKLPYSQLSSAYTVFTYFLMHMQKNRNRITPSDTMLPQYEHSCYTAKETIKAELGIDKRNLDKAIENLIYNGYLCQLIGTGKSKNPKYYFFVLLEANPTFCIEHSNAKIKKPNAFGGQYGHNTKRK